MDSAKKIFVVRAKPHNINREDQFLGGTISIGWPTSESLNGKNRDDLEEFLKKAYPDITSMSITQIHNFTTMPIGSIVLTPSYKNRDIHVFETIADYSYSSEWSVEQIGNPHTINVKYLKTLERSHFSEIINRALLAAKKTVTNFSKYSDEILMSIGEDTPGIHDTKEFKSAQNFETEIEARQTLKELLKSPDDEIRLKAALALLNKA